MISTNLPALSTFVLTPDNASSGTGVPDAGQLDPVTTYTETEVQPCPSTGGNGYGYYPNGPVPADGTNVAGQTVAGGVVYDQTVTTNRFGTTTYSGWYQVNFLCTAIPYPPGCPSGEVQTVAPYWDWGSNSWQGLQCTNPIPTASEQVGACTAAWDNYYNVALQSEIQLFGNSYLNYYTNHILPSSPVTGPVNETGTSVWDIPIQNYENIGWIYTEMFALEGSIL